MDVRVRLVFADDVGRHVQRRRGFSSCWYLVPNDVKLVGDLAHALLREFELRKRCPKGLELRLEELPLLATQSIRIVRDNDTIVVQCPPLEDEKDSSSESSSSESETEVLTNRKRKLHVKKKQAQPKKKKKTMKAVEKEVKDRQRASTKSREMAVKTLAAAKQSSKVESISCSSSSSSSSASDSSSESSSESSSSSESEDEPEARSNGKRVAKTTAAKQQTRRSTVAASAKVSNGEASKANALEQTGKEPQRRRRRLRQRNGRRQRNGNQVDNADSSTPLTPLTGNGTASLRQNHAAVVSDHVSTFGRQDGGNIAGPRGYPRSKAHVLFDEVTGNQVAKHHHEDVTRENASAVRRSPAPELAKYGPSSPDNQRIRAPRNNQDQNVSLSIGLTERDEKAVDSNRANKRKGKGKYEERWKRPYEILATVLDKTSQNSSTSSSSPPDLSKALASYPTAPAASSRFEPKDVIAFKTLTLCLETCQPLLSEWKCGQVQSADASCSTIEVSNWILEADGESVNYRESRSDESCSVQISEISELRFLSGPNYTSLQQTTPPETS
ncbi:hypothetical protein L914_05852 [Phytophthora nicotianae]|uniref:Coilin N-terminal domain-containing protein n=1 Tax=Phytophthora nicotianae TaxID=4792 RepID=W2NN63_PHYNI|nr:hypothetical protein L914_05852 [Phytophthora nicotianae]